MNESIIQLIDKLSLNLSKLALDSDINDYSLVRKDFVKKSKRIFWNLLLFKNAKHDSKLQVNGVNKMMYFTFELKKLDDDYKSNKIQDLVEEFSLVNPDYYGDILEFLVNFKKFDSQPELISLEDSIKNFSMHSKIIETNTDIPIDILKTIKKYTGNKSWINQNLAFENKEYFKELTTENELFKNYFSINPTNALNDIQALNHETLFSSLVSKKAPASAIHQIHLDIPDLPNDINFLNWQIPQTPSYEWIDYHNLMLKTTQEANNNIDEGFCSIKCSPTSQKTTDEDKLDKDVWEAALNLSITDYVDWEMRDSNTILITGNSLTKKSEKFLLIDSSKELFDKFYYNYVNIVNILNGSKSQIKTERLVISESKLITDCLNVLISLPSISFIWNKKNETFHFNDQLHISGLSCEAVSAYSQEFCQTGTYHRKLIEFVKTPSIDITCGSVFRSYCNAIKTYLDYYSEEILSNYNRVSSFTLASMHSKLKLVMDQQKFLYEISVKNAENLRGIDLIFYLYDLGRGMTNNTQDYSLFLHLFSKSIVPFLLFIETWIFKGEFFDPFNEFLIDFNYRSLVSKDKNFLQKAFRLKERFKHVNHQNDHDSYLLQNIYEDLFNCGKSLALLKICDPQHFLCNLIEYPKLNISLNSSYLKTVDSICDNYKSFVELNAKNNLKTRKEILYETSRQKQETLQRMQSEAMERFRLFKEKISEQKLIEIEKKKQRFDEMKAQMEADLKKREEEKMNQKLEDKEYMEKLMNRDFELNAKQKQLEQELKEEITQEYDVLMKKAEAREQAALERISEARKALNLQANEESQNRKEESDKQKMSLTQKQEASNNELIKNSSENIQIEEKSPIKEITEVKETNNKVDTLNESPVLPALRQKVNDETTEKEFKPSIRIQPNMNATTMSPTTTTPKTNIKLFENKHHSIETSAENYEAEVKKRIDLFKSKNIHGHASDSQIKDMFSNWKEYVAGASQQAASIQENENLDQLALDEKNQIEKFIKFTSKDNRISMINFDEIIQSYPTEFDFNSLNSNLLTYNLIKSNEVKENIERNRDPKIESESKLNKLFSYNYLNVEEILQRIMFKPIQIQNEIVNKCLINYFFTQLKLEEHLIALRQYMLFESSEFSQTFINELCETIIFTTNRFNNLNRNLLNPVYVNEALDKAIASVSKSCKYVENFSVRIDYNKEKARQTVVSKNSHETSNYSVNYQKQILIFLSCLELKYKLDWPLNLIITDKCMRNYNQIFGFLLQIKLILTALNNIWNTLKCFATFNKRCADSEQLKQMRLFSREMQHYLSALQNYVYNQVIQVAWKEFEKKLDNVKNLDDLIKAHEHYIDYALSRCFLTKASTVLESILNIFQNILKFRLLLVSDTFAENTETKKFEHKFFNQMSETFSEFRGHSVFLYKVLQRIVAKSHEFHVNNLALTLNYNYYYYGNDLVENK